MKRVAALISPYRELLSLAVLAVAVAWPLWWMLRYSAATMEEGSLLVGGELVLRGWTPHGDFEHLYGPADVWFVAAPFALFGNFVIIERFVGLAYRLLLLWAVHRITRRWGWGTAAGATLLAWAVIVPFGLIAYSWVGAIAFGAASLAAALDAEKRPRLWAVSGVLAGLALLFRADLVLGLGLSLVPLVWTTGRQHWKRFVGGLSAGVAAYAVHLLTAGPAAVFRGMFLDPVLRLRPGRRLPVPPRLDDSSEFFARLDHYLHGSETLPGLDLPAQITALFWIVLVAAGAAVWLAWRSGDRRLLALALLAAGTLPQMLQRASPNHIKFVGVLVLPAAAVALANRLGRLRSASSRDAGGSGAEVSRAGGESEPLGGGVGDVGGSGAGVHLAMHLGRRGAGGLVAVLMLAGLVVVAPHHVGRVTARAFLDPPAGVWADHGGRVLPVVDRQAADELEGILVALDSVAAPGDRLFVGPERLARTNYSETFLYHLAPDYEPASYHLQMNPGLANRVGGRLAEDMASADWLILTSLFDGWVEPNRSVEDGDLRADAVVESLFCPVEAVGARTLYGRCRGEVPQG